MNLVATGRYVDLGAVVVYMDGVWEQEDRIGEFTSCGCSCKHGPEESMCHRLFSTAQYTEMHNECRELSREELDINLNSVYSVCVIHGDYYMAVEIRTYMVHVCIFIQKNL